MLRLAVHQHDAVRWREQAPQSARGNESAHAASKDDHRFRWRHVSSSSEDHDPIGPECNDLAVMA
jgi:hypothetical protein